MKNSLSNFAKNFMVDINILPAENIKRCNSKKYITINQACQWDNILNSLVIEGIIVRRQAGIILDCLLADGPVNQIEMYHAVRKLLLDETITPGQMSAILNRLVF